MPYDKKYIWPITRGVGVSALLGGIALSPRCLILCTLTNTLWSRQQIVKHRFHQSAPQTARFGPLVLESVFFIRILPFGVPRFYSAFEPRSSCFRRFTCRLYRPTHSRSGNYSQPCQSPELCVLHIVINELQHARVRYPFRRSVSSRRCYASIYSDGRRKHAYRVRLGIGYFDFFYCFTNNQALGHGRLWGRGKHFYLKHIVVTKWVRAKNGIYVQSIYWNVHTLGIFLKI